MTDIANIDIANISDDDLTRLFEEDIVREVREAFNSTFDPVRFKAKLEHERAESQRMGWPAYVELQRKKYPLKPREDAKPVKAAPKKPEQVTREVGDDDPITLQEARSLIYRGNITLTSLKAKADAGVLKTWKVGRATFTRKRYIREMEECLEDRKGLGSTSIRAVSNGPSETDKASSALAALNQTVRELKRGSSSTSPPSTSQRQAPRR